MSGHYFNKKPRSIKNIVQPVLKYTGNYKLLIKPRLAYTVV